ncbi:MAG: 2,3-diketo-5-methylthiopentyl-1-phosphate enolase [Candidatus Omnitrophica bacterium]|nr:2,3-diketo-5-methylthiopentyl-1-phosphate enolase [Candidatus Omnitrophota bacterium]
MRECVIATYRLGLAASDDLDKKAKGIALGQTVGAWTPLQQMDPAVWERHRGEVLSTERPAPEIGIVKIAFPTANCETDIPSLLTMVFGKVSLDGRIKLLDLEFPAQWITKFTGPKVGIAGIRELLNVPARPLAMAIFKPCVGLSPAQLGEMFYPLGSGGLDLIKDDEILPDLPAAPAEKRLEACLKSIGRIERETGRKILYALNLTGPAGSLVQRAEELQAEGANCFLLNVLSYGWETLEEIASDPRVKIPIMAHPALSGALCASPEYGMSYPLVLGKLMRLGGADIVLYPAHYGTFPFPAEDEFGIRDALRKPWNSSEHLSPAWPAPSVGIHPGMVPRLLADYGNDVIINAGGGVHGHKGGPQAGARAMKQAVDLALAGQKFDAALPPGHEELATAIQQWGIK